MLTPKNNSDFQARSGDAITKPFPQYLTRDKGFVNGSWGCVLFSPTGTCPYLGSYVPTEGPAPTAEQGKLPSFKLRLAWLPGPLPFIDPGRHFAFDQKQRLYISLLIEHRVPGVPVGLST